MAAKRDSGIVFIGNRAFRVRVPRGAPTEQGESSEWDRILDCLGVSDGLLHWLYMWSWCQEPVYGHSFLENAAKNVRPASHRMLRGCSSARSFTASTSTNRANYMGYRPVLEAVDPDTFEPDDSIWEDVADGTVMSFGSLYMDNEPLIIPQSPTDLGDIPDYIPGASLHIGETDLAAAKQMRLIKCGNIFISDRNLLKRVSWEDLDRNGLVFGNP